MRRVILETPYRGRVIVSPLEGWWLKWRNRVYARQAVHDCLMRGEAPFASHLLYSQVLHDNWPDERDIGIQAGLTWLAVADASVVYVDRGVSEGVRRGIAAQRSAASRSTIVRCLR